MPNVALRTSPTLTVMYLGEYWRRFSIPPYPLQPIRARETLLNGWSLL
jgi:hypothetical protein